MAGATSSTTPSLEGRRSPTSLVNSTVPTTVLGWRSPANLSSSHTSCRPDWKDGHACYSVELPLPTH